jgi:hypothetical protein
VCEKTDIAEQDPASLAVLVLVFWREKHNRTVKQEHAQVALFHLINRLAQSLFRHPLQTPHTFESLENKPVRGVRSANTPAKSAFRSGLPSPRFWTTSAACWATGSSSEVAILYVRQIITFMYVPRVATNAGSVSRYHRQERLHCSRWGECTVPDRELPCGTREGRAGWVMWWTGRTVGLRFQVSGSHKAN